MTPLTGIVVICLQELSVTQRSLSFEVSMLTCVIQSAIERTLGNSLSSFTQPIRAKAIFRSVSPLNKSKRDEPQTSPSPGRSIISMLIDKLKTEQLSTK